MRRPDSGSPGVGRLGVGRALFLGGAFSGIFTSVRVGISFLLARKSCTSSRVKAATLEGETLDLPEVDFARATALAIVSSLKDDLSVDFKVVGMEGRGWFRLGALLGNGRKEIHGPWFQLVYPRFANNEGNAHPALEQPQWIPLQPHSFPERLVR